MKEPSFAGVDWSVNVTVNDTDPDVGVAANFAWGVRLLTGAGFTVIIIVAGSLLTPFELVIIKDTLKSIGLVVLFTNVWTGFSSVDWVSSPKFQA